MKKGLALVGLVFIILISTQITSATITDTITAYGYKGYPGDTINFTVKLMGDRPTTRSGYWCTLYTPFEEDSETMNISSWITIDPIKYELDEGEAKVFNVTIRIPKDAKPGLYGINSSDAPSPGHWYQRRTWICFRDADISAINATGVAAWTGFRIPVSVEVMGKEPFISAEDIGELITINLSYILFGIIIILIILLFRAKREK